MSITDERHRALGLTDDEYALMDLLSDTLSATPVCCPDCQSLGALVSQPDRGRLSESALQIG